VEGINQQAKQGIKGKAPLEQPKWFSKAASMSLGPSRAIHQLLILLQIGGVLDWRFKRCLSYQSLGSYRGIYLPSL